MRRRLRLRRNEDFARLRREGRTYHHGWMTLSFAPNGRPYNRYGFVAGKHLGTAVSRNRVRRLLRESARLLHPQLHAGYDIAFIARHPIVGQPLVAVQRIVRELAQRAGILVEGEME
jgi:ribonuclease P protein component